MNNPIVVWFVIAGVLLFTLVLSTVVKYHTSSSHVGKKALPLFELGHQRDIFFIPGDVDEDDSENF